MMKMIWSRLAPVFVVLVPLALSHGLAYWSGQSAERDDWRLRTAEQGRRDEQVIADLQRQLRHAETRATSDLLAAETRYRKDLQNVESEKNRLLAGLRAGAVRLSVPVKPQVCQPAGAAPGGAEGGTDPAPRAELSDAAAGFLVELGAEADAVAVELNRCADRVDVLERLFSPQ